MRSRTLAIVGLALVFPAGPAAGEDGAGPEGPRLRVTSAAIPSGRLVGTLVGVDEESLTVRPSNRGGDIQLKRESIAQLEISRRRGNRGKAIGLGVLIGATVGAALGAAAGDDCGGGEFLCFTRGETAAALALLGAPAGALVGLAASHGEKWETTTADGLRMTIGPTRGGVAVSLSFGF